MQYNAPNCSGEYNPMTTKPVGKLDAQERKARHELKYEWIAKYKDGVELKQYDDQKQLVYHFGHIDQERVIEFILESKTDPKSTISVNLESGLFCINKKPVEKIRVGKTLIPLGLSFGNKKIVSSWGNKAKLIFVRHVRKDFDVSTSGVSTKINYELGYEAEIDGSHQKHTIVVDERGHFGIPITLEQEGFMAL